MSKEQSTSDEKAGALSLPDEPTDVGSGVQEQAPGTQWLPPMPAPEEMLPEQRRWLWGLIRMLGLWTLGLVAGLWFAPDTPQTAQQQVTALQATIKARDRRIGELEQIARAPEAVRGPGKLSHEQRHQLEREGRRYVATLRRTGAQGAANLMVWFVQRWIQLLDYPLEDDRINRRAATLALLVGGMAPNINPGDYIPWQAEFLSNTWLPEIHRDIDGDGLPATRKATNTHDGFANVSVCHVAMALNQALTDGQILMMPEMRCDRPDSRMSVFLQGETFDDALSEFVRAVREQGFLVVEREEKGSRLVLVGNRPVPARDDD